MTFAAGRAGRQLRLQFVERCLALPEPRLIAGRLTATHGCWSAVESLLTWRGPGPPSLTNVPHGMVAGLLGARTRVARGDDAAPRADIYRSRCSPLR